MLAAAVAGLVASRPGASDPAPRAVEREREPQPEPPSEGLPPGHPPTTAGMPAGHPPTADVAPPADDAALSWKVPDRWKQVASPSPMRLATYRLPGADDAECSVVRAGGTADANVERWIGQFDEASRGSATRSSSTVRGLQISRLEIRGTYLGGGAMGAASEPRRGWALLGVVVGTPRTSYFFKVTGPEAAVIAARADMDTLVASLAPNHPR